MTIAFIQESEGNEASHTSRHSKTMRHNSTNEMSGHHKFSGYIYDDHSFTLNKLLRIRAD